MAKTRINIRRINFFTRYREQKHAQSILEYALLITCLVLALLAMKTYVKRGMQGRLREAAAQLGQQYEPGRTTGTSRVVSTSTSTVWTRTQNEKNLTFDLDGDGAIKEEVFGTTSNQSVVSFESEVGNEKIIP